MKVRGYVKLTVVVIGAILIGCGSPVTDNRVAAEDVDKTIVEPQTLTGTTHSVTEMGHAIVKAKKPNAVTNEPQDQLPGEAVNLQDQPVVGAPAAE